MTSKQAQHTPGPWRAVRFSERSQLREPHSHVEYYDGEDWHRVTLHVTDELADRMVRELNAAPELLAACRRAIAYMQHDTSEKVGERGALMADLRAAIAKTEGREP